MPVIELDSLTIVIESLQSGPDFLLNDAANFWTIVCVHGDQCAGPIYYLPVLSHHPLQMAEVGGAGHPQAAAILRPHVNGHLPWLQRGAREVEVHLVVAMAQRGKEHHVEEVLLAAPEGGPGSLEQLCQRLVHWVLPPIFKRGTK